MNTRTLLIITGISGAIAVALGALGAHALEQKVQEGILTDKNLSSYKTAVLYQLVHTLALLCIVPIKEKFNAISFNKSIYSFIVGILLFSGSIYLLSTANLTGLANLKFLGPLTPIGGILFIAGWLFLGFNLYKNKE